MPIYTYQRLLIWLFAITLAVSALFTSFPQLDIAVSGLFYRQGFWLHDLAALEGIRQALIWFMYIFALGTLAAFLGALVRRHSSARALGFVVMTILLGPLLLVNGVLKSYWGRARPIDITAFGGDKTFSPAYLFSDQCSTNCSFTSGEGAGIATAAILIGFLLWPKLAKKRRWVLGAMLVALVCVGAGLRVATGQHFMSDTLLSMLFCALIAAGLYRLFYPAVKE